MKYTLITLTVVLFFAAPVFSQNSTGGPPPIDRTMNTDRIRQQDMSSREYQLRNFGKQPADAKDDRHVKALMAQTEEDFTRILTLHNEIARALTSKNALDYKFVSEATGEIKKRASRVQSTLALSLPPEEALQEDQSAQSKNPELKDSLVKLCNHIRSFVTNPTIDKPNTVDAKELSRARRDLESLIQLSGRIKKDAEKLKSQK